MINTCIFIILVNNPVTAIIIFNFRCSISLSFIFFRVYFEDSPGCVVVRNEQVTAESCDIPLCDLATTEEITSNDSLIDNNINYKYNKNDDI